MTVASAPLDRLRQRQPEWGPWLAVVEEALRDVPARAWEAAVPAAPDSRAPGVPLLAGAEVSVPPEAARELLERLVRVACHAGTPKMTSLERLLGRGNSPRYPASAGFDAASLFTASVRQDYDRVRQMAEAAGIDPDALQGVAGLLPVPFLLACNRRWAPAVPEGWVEGYCPVCAAWPAFVEVRGIERSRCSRCGRCGAEWHARMLACPFCELNDHERLVTLTPEGGPSRGVIEGCMRCLGYVKAFTRLQGCPPASVLLEDLATVDLDVAALQEGYVRPEGKRLLL